MRTFGILSMSRHEKLRAGYVAACQMVSCKQRLGIPFSLASRFLLFSFISLFAFHSSLFAASGKTTAKFLEVDVGAKSSAMAGTQFSSENDSFAQFYNPALLSGIHKKEIGFMHNEFFLDLTQELLTYVQPTARHGNFAAAINYFNYGKIPGFNAVGTTIGDLSANDLLMAGSWGGHLERLPIKNFSAGLSVKFLRKTLSDSSAVGFATDLGLLYSMNSINYKYLHGLKVAGSIQNLGTGLKFKNESNPFPQTLRIGIAYSFWGDALTTTIDGVSAMDSQFAAYPTMALEYKLFKVISVRLGYKGDSGLDNNLSYGIGFENPVFRLDYAFVPFGNLGDTHRASVLIRFGKNYRHPVADSQLQEKINYAKRLYAQGQILEAYLASFQLKQVAGWLSENNKFLEKIQKDFRELENKAEKEKLDREIAVLFERGEKFFEEGNLINARFEFLAVLGLQPENRVAQGYLKQIDGQFRSFVENFYRTGTTAFAAENYQQAKEEFEKVLVIDPDHQSAKKQLALCMEILEKRKKETETAAEKERVSKIYQEALTAYEKESYEEAITLFSELLGPGLESQPQQIEAKQYIQSSKEKLSKIYLEEGEKFSNKGDWEPAIKNLRSALAFNPNSDKAKSLLQEAQRRGELQKRVISQNLYKEGLEAFLNGDRGKTKLLWKKALELDPQNEEARRGLPRLDTP